MKEYFTGCNSVRMLQLKVSSVLTILMVLILQFISINSNGQTCYTIYEDAKYLYLLKSDKYKKLSESILDKEIKSGSKNFKIYLLKSRMLYEKGKPKSAFPLLLTAVNYGCDYYHHIFTNNFFKKYITKSDSMQIIKFAGEDVEIPFKTVNKLELADFYELVHWDQAVNWFMIKYHDSVCLSPKQYRKLHVKLINSMILKDYLEKYGYPDEKEFGSDLVNRFDNVIIHQESWEWLKPYYDKAFRNNKISIERYYNFYDGLLIEKSLPQKYGAFENGKLRNGRYEIHPVDNIKNIDVLRRNVGLPPLHVFLKNNNIAMPKGYHYDMATYLNSVQNKLKQ